jgi:nitroreductase
MEFSDVVQARRSIRAYTAQDVSQEQVMKVIGAGHAAPSGGNLKEWRFIVVREEARKRKVVQATFCRNNEANPPQEWLMQAPVLVAVVADLAVAASRYGRMGIDRLVYLDCACAVQNMLLCAVDMGLASCFICGFREHEMAQALCLPDTAEAVALVPLGYPAAEGVRRPCVPAEEVTYFETWCGWDERVP